MNIRQPNKILGALALAGLMAGCGKPYKAATPDGFIDLSDRYESADNDEYRAATADGVVLGIRAYKNEPKVEMNVAIQALENRVRLGQGYALIAEKDVTARDGTKGKMLQFGHDEPRGPHLYYVTLFITPKRVFVLEAGGKKELVDAAQKSIDWSIANFYPE